MINRLLRQVLKTFILLFLLFSGNVMSQNIRIPDAIVSLCPNTNFDGSIILSGFQNLDTLSLTVVYNPTAFEYKSNRQPFTALTDSGFYQVTELNNSSVRFTWGAKPGGSISLPDNQLIEFVFEVLNGNDSIYFDETSFYAENKYGATISASFDGARVNAFPRMSVIIDEIDATCPDACDANIAAYVSGGLPPYQFLWNGVESVFDSVLSNACGGNLSILITDANQCELDTIFNVSLLDSAAVELITSPDTIYMQNPLVNFSFEADDSVIDWEWDFGDNTQRTREKNPFHVFSSAANPNDNDGFTVRLTTVTESGCTKITSFFLPISELPIFIPNVFTPNESDQVNNYFVIAKRLSDDLTGEKIPITTEYMRMELLVFDRWGRKVYEDSDYKSNWDGDNLPEGTYFYRLNTYGYYKNESFKGSVTILR
jgi:hypothetical protein